MMIHGYSKLRNLKQAAEETKQTLGIPVGATYTATILEFFGGFVSDNRPNCSDSWIVFCYFYDCKCDYEENKDNAAYIAPGKASYKISITYLILSIILIVLGAGALSVDSVIGFW